MSFLFQIISNDTCWRRIYRKWWSRAETGLGTDPAEFIPVLEVLFPSKENYLADKSLLKQHVLDVWVEAKYLNYQY